VYNTVTLELLIFLFTRYLYQQLQNAYNEKPSVFLFQEESNLCSLKNGVSFHLFTSHTPCECFTQWRFYVFFYTLPLPQRIEIAFNMTDWRFGWGGVTSDSLLTLALEKEVQKIHF